MKATDNKTHDSQCAVELVENSVKKVESLDGSVEEVIANAGVYSHEIFRQLASKGIKSVTKVRRDAVIRGNKSDTAYLTNLISDTAYEYCLFRLVGSLKHSQ